MGCKMIISNAGPLIHLGQDKQAKTIEGVVYRNSTSKEKEMSSSFR